MMFECGRGQEMPLDLPGLLWDFLWILVPPATRPVPVRKEQHLYVLVEWFACMYETHATRLQNGFQVWVVACIHRVSRNVLL